MVRLAIPRRDPLDAVIVTGPPAATPVAVPAGLPLLRAFRIVAMAVLEEVHVT